MPQMNTDRQEVVLLEDRYPAVLKEVNEYEKDYGDGPQKKLAWIFEVEAGEDAIDPDVEYEGEATGIYEVAAHTSFATGKNSNFAKLGFPAWVGEDWDGDTDNMLGQGALVDVTSYETKGGQTRNVIEKVRQPRAKKGRGSKAAEEAEAQQLNEADFSDIPL